MWINNLKRYIRIIDLNRIYTVYNNKRLLSLFLPAYECVGDVFTNYINIALAHPSDEEEYFNNGPEELKNIYEWLGSKKGKYTRPKYDERMNKNKIKYKTPHSEIIKEIKKRQGRYGRKVENMYDSKNKFPFGFSSFK